MLIKNDDFAYNRSISGEKIFGVIRKLENYENGVISPVYIAFRLKNKHVTDSVFLQYYYLTDIWHKEAKNIVFKGARQLLNVSINDFFDMKLIISPNYLEQHRIGRLLSNLDSLIALHQRKLSSLKNLKNRLLDKMFCDEKSQFPSIRFKEFTNAWEQEKLKNLTDRIIEKNTHSQSSRVLTISQHQGLIDQNDFFNHRVASKNLKNYLLIKNDDFAYNRSISGEKIFGVIRKLENYENGVISPVYIAFRLKNKHVTDSVFLQYYYLTDIWHKEAKNIVFKGARQLLNVSINDFFDMKLIISPNYLEQHRIGRLLSNLDSLIALHQRKLSSLKNLKNRLLDKMFCDEKSQFPSIRFKEFTNAWEQWKVGDLIKSAKVNICRSVVKYGKYEVIEQGIQSVFGYSNNTNETPYWDYEPIVLFGDHTLSIYKPKSPFFIASDGVKAYYSLRTNGYYLFYSLERYKPLSDGYKRYSSTLKSLNMWITENDVEQSKISSLFTLLDSLITLHQRG
ncbi:restriction endonuclease subunit S [Mycoplasmopsis agalactiae]|uniref:Type I R/M system specificity subunit n=1 Tax=Mycoplasmopsis agalactiae TaxID=2110 RepID=D3VR90_MYCAA|nr:restriction endonuclease subunit S [Mycoplasmopsis agalactiae]CBH40837.1 Type I R/M system specificity subunit [Mycoplasmopsis agalactiae]